MRTYLNTAALGAVLALTATATLLGSIPADAEKPRGSYKYSVSQCNKAYGDCGKWCDANRFGAERTQCNNNCFDYYVKCMGARYRATTRPGINNPNLPAERSP